jgi:hypothetical protein
MVYTLPAKEWATHPFCSQYRAASLSTVVQVLQFCLSSHVLQTIRSTRRDYLSERARSLKEIALEQFALTNEKMRRTTLLSFFIQVFVMTSR